MSRIVLAEGSRFGRLVVVHPCANLKKNYNGTVHVFSASQCRCDCGKELEVPNNWLTKGRVRSCGCLQRDMVSRKRGSTAAKKPKTKQKILRVVSHKDRWYNGYKMVYHPEHEGAIKTGKNKGYIYEHRYMMELHLGRVLRDDEVVHHNDFNRSNNDLSNLRLMTKGEHSKLHSDMRYGEARKRKPKVQSKFRFSMLPNNDVLVEDAQVMSFCGMAKKYGVSETAIRRHFKRYGLEVKVRHDSQFLKSIGTYDRMVETRKAQEQRATA